MDGQGFTILFRIAGKMLLEKRSRLALVVVAASGAFFLALTQMGVLLGWIETTGALIRNSGVDIWIMAPHTPVYEYAGPIPERLIDRARSVPGVDQASGLFVGWAVWRLRDGSFKGVHVIGLDRDSVGGPWIMDTGRIEDVHQPYGVVVDSVYARSMGVDAIGEELTIYGQRARVCGFSKGVRTFTAAPYVFTGLSKAKRYDGRFRDDEITYVLVKVREGNNVEEVREAIANACPTAEVLSTETFARRTNSYWLIQTGAGLTLCLSIGLAIFISVTVLGQAMYAITHENIPQYGVLVALGYGYSKLCGVVVVQGLMLFLVSVAVSLPMYWGISLVSQESVLPIFFSITGIKAFGALNCVLMLLSAIVPIRILLNVDPILVFRV